MGEWVRGSRGAWVGVSETPTPPHLELRYEVELCPHPHPPFLPAFVLAHRYTLAHSAAQRGDRRKREGARLGSDPETMGDIT